MGGRAGGVEDSEEEGDEVALGGGGRFGWRAEGGETGKVTG